jgi:hypothetical protein
VTKPKKRISLLTGQERTSIEVDDWPGGLSPYRISTANREDRPDISLLPNQLQGAIRKRRQQAGQVKGRILYARQDLLGDREPIVVGALMLHLEGDVPQILELGVAASKSGSDREQLLNVMLACAVAVATELKSSTVEWLVHSDEAATSAARYGFRRLPRTRNAPRGVIRLSRVVQ